MVEDFPNINLDEAKNPIAISSMKFKEIINKTSFACSLQESRPLLTGVNIKIQGDIFDCTATDSYRLSKVSYKLDNICEENVNIVIPARNINELVKSSSYIPLSNTEATALPDGYYGSWLCLVKKPSFTLSSSCYVSGKDVYAVNRTSTLSLSDFKSYFIICFCFCFNNRS